MTILGPTSIRYLKTLYIQSSESPIYIHCIGKRSEDPRAHSLSYSSSIFGQARGAKDLSAMQQQRRLEAVQCRQRKKDEAEVVEEGDTVSEDAVEKSEDAMEADQSFSPGIGTSAESLEASFKSLEEDYQKVN